MLRAAREIAGFLRGKSLKQVRNDRQLSLAVVHDLAIIGEAASRITPATREKYPAIPWNDVIGMRNRLIHAYFEVDYRLVWDTAKRNLPPLALELARMLRARIRWTSGLRGLASDKKGLSGRQHDRVVYRTRGRLER